MNGLDRSRVFSYHIQRLEKSGVVRVLEGYALLPTPVGLIYASQRRVPLKPRAFLDFSIPRLRKRLDGENV